MYNNFNINKFCNNQPAVGYNKITTTGNNPKLSKAMQYSQQLRAKKPCKVSYNKLFQDVSFNINTPVDYDLQIDISLNEVTAHSRIDVTVLPSNYVIRSVDASNNNMDIGVSINGIMIINEVIIPYSFTDTYSQMYNSVTITTTKDYSYDFTAVDVPVTNVVFYYTFTTNIMDSLVAPDGSLISDLKTVSQIYGNNKIDLSMNAIYENVIPTQKHYGFTPIDPELQQKIYALSKQPMFNRKYSI